MHLRLHAELVAQNGLYAELARLQFDHVLAGEAGGGGKPERQAVIERNAGARKGFIRMQAVVPQQVEQGLNRPDPPEHSCDVAWRPRG